MVGGYNPATHYYTYTVTSVVGAVVTVGQEEVVTFPISLTYVFDVTSTTKTDVDEAQVVASGLSIGDEVLEILNFGGTTIHGYVDALETLAGKTLLVSHFSTAILQFTAKYFQDSGVLYSLTEVTPLGTVNMYQCTTGDPVTSLPTYIVTASAGAGGSISPSGSVVVLQGNSQTFTITPNNGYTVSGVIVDGVSLSPPVLTYTFTNVQADHTIVASFSLLPPNQYSISASAGTGGSISPLGSVLVNQGSNQAFTITANNGYIISAVLVDGTSQGAVSTYSFTNVQASHTISASFSSTENVNYFLLMLLDLLGNNRLMLIVGASITLISTIMLFWPKPKPQY
jgi:hypothetical protein